MATKVTTTAPATTRKGKAAPAPAPVGNNAAAPQAPLFTLGTLPNVRTGTHRHYAQQVARQLAKANPKGFTLAQYRTALVANAQGSNIAPPTHGWAKHNMPTWAAGQGWLVPVA